MRPAAVPFHFHVLARPHVIPESPGIPARTRAFRRLRLRCAAPEQETFDKAFSAASAARKETSTSSALWRREFVQGEADCELDQSLSPQSQEKYRRVLALELHAATRSCQ